MTSAAPFGAQRGGYEISTDLQRLDFEAIHAYLTRSYWSPGISRALVEKAAAGSSLCFGLYHGQAQVGYARVISDQATFAYLSDVYVLEEHRGQGLSKWLVQTIQAHPGLQCLRRFMLATRDAHGLYAGFGFTPVAHPERLMEIVVPDAHLHPAQAAGG
jgi:GNAT superfamily N-acetyltransferase